MIVFCASMPEHSPSETPHEQQTETVLLVEDEPTVRTVIRLALERQGFQVLEAQSSSHAVSLCEDHAGPIHLLLVDAQTSEMTGQRLAQEVVGQRPQTRVLYISGYPRELLEARGLLSPSQRFLQKPFMLTALVAKIREILA
jgi:DNA-binding response OmpR family regulator